MSNSSNEQIHQQAPVKLPLQALVESFEFRKINTGLLVVPSVFAVLSLALLSLGLNQVLVSLEQSTGETVSPMGELLVSQTLLWGMAALLGFTIASMVTTYSLLRDLKEHFYQSGVSVYYFTGGSSFEGAMQYLRSMVARSTLPAPVTGTLLVFLTTGIAYPVILCVAEKAIREHAVVEEKALFKQELTARYSWPRLLVDIALAFLTLGAYMAYMGFRLAKLFNKHVELVHGNHPNPPNPLTLVEAHREAEPRINLSLLVCLFLVTGILNVLASSLGFFTVHFVVPASGVLLSTLVLVSRKHRNFSTARTTVIVLGLLYVLLLSGFSAGLVNYKAYKAISEVFSQQGASLKSLGLLGLSLYIFTNNLVVSLSSIIPYIGSILVALGGHNAGLIMGAIVGNGVRSLEEALLVLVYPHAVLELSAYAVLVTSSSLFGEWRKYVKVVLVGVMLLLVAAVVEAASILLK